ncbi:MAG: hypothetical protein AAFR64_09975 [Pseudomonadota bacterium]
MTIGKTIFGLLTAATLFAGGATALSAKGDSDKTAPPASDFAPIQRYAIAYDRPRDLAEFYLSEFGLKTYGAKIEQLDHPTNPDMRVMLITIDPIEDGSVNGVQWRFDLSSNGGMWRTETAGMRRKCSKGANPNEWTREVCP